VLRVATFVAAGQHDPRFELSTELILQGVPKHERLVLLDVPLLFRVVRKFHRTMVSVGNAFWSSAALASITDVPLRSNCCSPFSPASSFSPASVTLVPPRYGIGLTPRATRQRP
jgi:hypothetical protein